jgi:hypothetical protein
LGEHCLELNKRISYLGLNFRRFRRGALLTSQDCLLLREIIMDVA